MTITTGGKKSSQKYSVSEMHSIGRTIAANPACESYESISLFSIQALFAVPPPFFFGLQDVLARGMTGRGN